MKKTITILLLLAITSICFAQNIVITATDILPELVRMDFDYMISLGGDSSYSNVLYLTQYQIVYIQIKNNTESVLFINPNYFTLISSYNISLPYSSETHVINDKISWLTFTQLQSVDVYPGTTTAGILLFEKEHDHEYPVTIYFNGLNGSPIAVDVILDEKANYNR